MLVVGGGADGNQPFGSSESRCGGGSGAVWYLKNIPLETYRVLASIIIGKGSHSISLIENTYVEHSAGGVSYIWTVTARSAYRVDGAFVEDDDVQGPITNYRVAGGSNGGGGEAYSDTSNSGGGGSSNSGTLAPNNGGDGRFGFNGNGGVNGYGRLWENGTDATIPLQSIFEGTGQGGYGTYNQTYDYNLGGGAGGYGNGGYFGNNYYQTAPGRGGGSSGTAPDSSIAAQGSSGIVCLYYHFDPI